MKIPTINRIFTMDDNMFDDEFDELYDSIIDEIYDNMDDEICDNMDDDFEYYKRTIDKKKSISDKEIINKRIDKLEEKLDRILFLLEKNHTEEEL